MTQTQATTTSAYQQLRGHLHYLRLDAAAEALPAALDHAQQAKLGHTAFLEHLLGIEVTATQARRQQSRLRFAAFPAPWRLEDFDFDAQPSLDRALVGELATLRFIDEHANVLLIGPPGVGKTHLALALGYLPLPSEGAAALFQVIAQRYLKGSIALTTNRGIASWGQIFDDPMVAAAMLDRLLHRSTVLQIDGESYRMRAHRARVEGLRKGVAPTKRG